MDDDAPDQPPAPARKPRPAKDAKAEKEARLAAALRANLRRRKARAKAAETEDDE